MSRHLSILVVVLAFTGFASAAPCPDGEWCQWTVAEGGNGHWYRLTAPGLTWLEAGGFAIQQDGYSAIYYTYMWSLVIAKDLLSEFERDGLLNSKTARRYRDTILSPGGSKPAAELVRDFLGRPFSFDAFEAWLNRM